MKIFNKFAASVLGAMAILASCTEPAPTSYTVTGLLPDSSMNGQAFYITQYNNGVHIDTTVIDGNKFTFDGVADSASLCFIFVNRNVHTFILENGNITIDINENKVSGTDNNDILTEIATYEDSIHQKIINTASEDARKAIINAGKAKFNEWFAQHNNDEVGFYLLRTDIFHNHFEAEEKIAVYESCGATLAQGVKSETSRLRARMATEVGQPYTDFDGKDAAGNPVKLSDYVGKGNYVLVDMWASWCVPCKREIPNLAEVHNLYKDKGLTVLGIFVWDDVKNLEPTLKAENVTWAQIIDTEKVSTIAYGVNSIPAIMLFGPDGTIMERDKAVRGKNMKPTIEKYLLKK